jgi:hypothetical protein
MSAIKCCNNQIAACFGLLSCLPYVSTLKLKVKCPSETSVGIQRTIRHYIPEDGTLQNRRSMNLMWNHFIIAPFKDTEYFVTELP